MIRVCKEEEYSVLIEILRSSFAPSSIDKRIEEKFGKVIGFDWWERKAVDVMKQVEDFPGGVYVEELEGKITGFITTYVDRKFSTGRICTLAIRPKHQGKGIGTRLIIHALKIFKEEKLKLARIEVLEENKGAYKLYKKFGFEPVASNVNMARKIDK